LFCIVAAPVIGGDADANRRVRRYSTRIQAPWATSRVAKEGVDAHRLIKIFNAEDHQPSA